ncbi:hypothetical protein HK104_001007 [Borealophlyctis nickersoniae]|nr:hypothetical protein HK104_001007 [Borealophlyctis nickersoniae]
MAKMVWEETEKPKGKFAHYSTWDHIERLYDSKSKPTKDDIEELTLIRNTMGPKVPGFDQFLTEARYCMIKGKFAYNAYVVTSQEERFPSAVASTEASRGTAPTETRKGAGLYMMTSYISHSCDANADVMYPEDTADLAVIARKSLKAGDEIFISYLPVEGKETSARRKELKAKSNANAEG